MLRHGQPYAYNLYPPLQPEACPLCGARLTGREPLAGQLACPTMGLPFLEFPVCLSCQPKRFGTAWRITDGAIAVLIAQFHLDSTMDWDPERDGPPLSAHSPDYDQETAEPLLWVDEDRWTLRWLPELVPVPAQTRPDPAQAHFSWQPQIGFPLLRWGDRGVSPYTIHRLPPRTEAAEGHPDLRKVTLPFADELQHDTNENWWGVAEWKLLPLRGDDEDLYKVAPWLRPEHGQRRVVSEMSYALFAFTGSAQWVVAGLPAEACHRSGFAQAWLKQVCQRQADLTGTGVPILPAACFYFILRALESNSLPNAAAMHAFIDAIGPAMHAVNFMVHRCFVEKLGFEPLAEPLPYDALRDWAARYIQDDDHPAALAGTYNLTVALDHIARSVSAADFPARIAARRRQQSGPEWSGLNFWEPDLDELAVIGLWVRSGGRRYGQDTEPLSLQGLNLMAETDRFAEAWRQWVDLQVWPTPSAAGLEFLFPGLKLTPTANYDWHVAEVYAQTTGEPAEKALVLDSPETPVARQQRVLGRIAQANPNLQAADIDEVRCFNVARGLLEEAQARRQYVPLGGYRVMLPADMMLRKVVGIQALRLWFEPVPDNGETPPDGCWVKDDVIIASSEGPLARGNAWWWSWANFTANQSGVPAFLWPNLASVLAAIYHDLVVAGESVMLETRNRPDGLPPLAWGSAVYTATRRRHPGKRDLPGRQYEVRGYPARNIQWGDPAEMDRVRRAAHAVRGHVMHLAPGHRASAAALERGRAYGLIPADGYTFVRPHIRGLDPARAADEPDVEALTAEVRARGLYSLITYLSTPASTSAAETD